MPVENYYDILGVKSTSNKAELKVAYRLSAKKYHPDRNPEDKNAEEVFKEIQEAYYVLSDKERRANYDLKFPFSSRSYQGMAYPQNKNNRYEQYASRGKSYAHNEDSFTSATSNKSFLHFTEVKQLTVSILLALLFLYFIMSY